MFTTSERPCSLAAPIPTLMLPCCASRPTLWKSTPPFTARQVYVNNQFGPDNFGSFRATDICVPSVKNLGL